MAESPSGTLVIGLSRLGQVAGRTGTGSLLRLEFSRRAAGSGDLVFADNQAFNAAGFGDRRRAVVRRQGGGAVTDEIRFWNTLGRGLEVFEPLDRERIRIYTCGPTVYDRAHIGNLRTFLLEDVLCRALELPRLSRRRR